jgi:hypothetical protein
VVRREHIDASLSRTINGRWHSNPIVQQVSTDPYLSVGGAHVANEMSRPEKEI